MHLRILSLGREEAPVWVQVAAHDSVNTLKQHVKERLQITEERQRLVYRGRVLQDTEPLSTYHLQDGHTVHCVARPEGVAPSAQPTNTSGPSQHSAADGPRMFMGGGAVAMPLVGQAGVNFLSHIMRIAGGNPADVPSGTEGQRNAGGMRSGIPSPASLAPTAGADTRGINENEANLEHVRQALLTVHSLVSGMASPERNLPEEEERGSLVRRRFYIGQWVDCKDTVNQWLEATIVNVDPERRKAEIRYNGWPPRWNEWLPFDSPRIAPFRSRTQQSAYSRRFSPFPLSNLDSSPSTGSDDLRTVLPEVTTILQQIQAYLSPLSSICEEDWREFVRQGRTDVSSSSWQEGALPWLRILESEQNASSQSRSDIERSEDGQQEAQTDEVEQESRWRRQRQLQSLAADVAPLLDRCGRLMTDLAPHVARMADELGTRSSSFSSSQTYAAVTPQIIPAQAHANVLPSVLSSNPHQDSASTADTATADRQSSQPPDEWPSTAAQTILVPERQSTSPFTSSQPPTAFTQPFSSSPLGPPAAPNQTPASMVQRRMLEQILAGHVLTPNSPAVRLPGPPVHAPAQVHAHLSRPSEVISMTANHAASTQPSAAATTAQASPVRHRSHSHVIRPSIPVTPRSRSPSPERTFRQLISHSHRPEASMPAPIHTGSLDIHIAFLQSPQPVLRPRQQPSTAPTGQSVPNAQEETQEFQHIQGHREGSEPTRRSGPTRSRSQSEGDENSSRRRRRRSAPPTEESHQPPTAGRVNAAAVPRLSLGDDPVSAMFGAQGLSELAAFWADSGADMGPGSGEGGAQSASDAHAIAQGSEGPTLGQTQAAVGQTVTGLAQPVHIMASAAGAGSEGASAANSVSQVHVPMIGGSNAMSFVSDQGAGSEATSSITSQSPHESQSALAETPRRGLSSLFRAFWRH